MNIKKICVIGGGNIGTYVAAYSKKHNYNVSLFVHDKNKFSSNIVILDEDKNTEEEFLIDLITSDLKEAIQDADLIFVTYPSFMFEELNKKLLPFVSQNTNLCFLPGTGGIEFAFSDCIKKGVHIFGFQRVPLVARLVEYGKNVHISGKRKCLFLGGINSNKEKMNYFKDFLSNLFETDCSILPNYLNVTLTPSNPILHTARLFSMFENYKETDIYERNFLFYEEWDNKSSENLIACDKELQKICKKIPLDLKNVISLPVYYESNDAETLTKKIISIPAFKGLSSPMVKVENGWKLDFNSRYFTADFPYGLKILIEVGKLFEVETPNMNKIWNWFTNLNLIYKEKCFKLENMTKEKFLELYE